MDLKSDVLTLQNQCSKVNPSVSKISLPLQTYDFGAENGLFQGFSRAFAKAGEYLILSPAIPRSKCVGTGKKKRRRTQAATWPPRPASLGTMVI